MIPFASCSEHRLSPDCSRFKTGRFLIRMQPEGNVFEINRYDNTQTEYDRADDSITGYKIRWTGTCEYELEKTNKRKKTISDSSRLQRIIEYVRATPLKVKIVTTGDDYCVFESRKEGIDFVYKDTMWILK